MNRKYNQIIHADCMDIMKDMPDGCIDVAIVDPPYGILNIGMRITKPSRPNSYKMRLKHKKKEWDKKPDKKYFQELFRVSKNQIIFGANYFYNHFPVSNGWVFWDKINGCGSHFADGEIIFTSFKKPIKKITLSCFHGTKGGKLRIHPTQKPIALYHWLLQNYAKPGQLILDTHSGSGSLACACHLEKFDFIAIEKDEDYHRDSVARLNELRAQGTLF